MSENPSEQEPSIEEILASIRQIISDDDEEETVEAVEEPEEVVESPIHEERDDVLDLTEEDLAEDEPAPEPEPTEEIEVEMVDRIEDEPEPAPEEEEEGGLESMVDDAIEEIRQAPIEPAAPLTPAPVPSDILSSATQAAALGSITKLASKMPINSARSYDGVTLEDIVREMLHPMLREWMDDNLPRTVERIVQKELEKLARRAMDD